MESSQKYWDKSASRYAKSPIKDESSYRKKLEVTQAYFQPDWSVLEFGCGTGSTAIIHAPYVKHYLATDISSKMLQIAERKAQDAGIDNLRFQQGTLDSLELETEGFDAVLGLNVLHLLEDVEQVLSRVHAVLKTGGVFVSSTVLISELKLHWRMAIPVMQAFGLAPYVNRFTKRELEDMLSRTGFSIDYEWQPRKDSVFIVAKKRNQAREVTV